MTLSQPFGGGAFLTPYQLWVLKSEQWWRWHEENPMIWQYFEKFAFEALRRGKKKTSHWLLMNRVRWEVFLVTTPREGVEGEDFKISNDYIAFYARYWKVRYPQYSWLLTTKQMIGEPPDSPWIGSK